MSTCPQITSLLPSSIVHSRLILVEGIVPNVNQGVLTITPQEQPTFQITIVNGIFKTVIPLRHGDNDIQLTHEDTTSHFFCTYEPLSQNPPLKLVILTASDSSLCYDDSPQARHPSTLETAIKKLRMAGYLWSAYTAKEMMEAGLGHRTFRLDESQQPDSLSCQSNAPAVTANVLVLKSSYTTEEIRNPDRAQQNHGAGAASSLFDIVLQALRENPSTNGLREHVAALILDAHFDGQLITGHAALGGGTSQHALAIFGSHSMFAWPICIEEIEGCFTDERPVDTNHCGIDCEGKSQFSAANVGIGAMMHEVGHLFGCPHQENGVMMRDYVRLHRSFTALEPLSASSVVGNGQCHWHRLDMLRFAGHPSFALLNEKVIPGSMSTLPTLDGLEVQSPSGVRVIEVYRPDYEFPVTWLEYDSSRSSFLVLREQDIRQRVQSQYQAGPLRLNFIAGNGSSIVIDDFAKLIMPFTLPDFGNLSIFKTAMLGANPGTHVQFTLAPSISAITIYSGQSLDGIEFQTGDTRSRVTASSLQLLGKRGGSPQRFELQAHEYLIGFNIRSGLWIDGIGIITNLAVYPFCGSQGGSEIRLVCPGGYRVCGVSGEFDQWMNKFQMMYTSM